LVVNLLYVTDNVFVKDGDAIYTGTQFNLQYWEAYLKVFDQCLAQSKPYMSVERCTSLRNTRGGSALAERTYLTTSNDFTTEGKCVS
jgi:hypothetical protein